MSLSAILEELIGFAKTIYSEKESLLNRVALFEKATNKTESAKVEQVWREFIERHRDALLLGPMYDYWLRKGDVILSYHGKKGFNLSTLYMEARARSDQEQQGVLWVGVKQEYREAPWRFLHLIYKIARTFDPEEKRYLIGIAQLDLILSGDLPKADGIGGFLGNLLQKFGLKKDDAPIGDDVLKQAFETITNNADFASMFSLLNDAKAGGTAPDAQAVLRAVKSLPMAKDLPPELLESVGNIFPAKP